MSLTSEIHALRAQLDAETRNAPAADKEARPSEPQAPAPDETATQSDAETFLAMINETLDDFAQELDKYPRLTALAALGIGLAVGVVIGRHSR